MLVKKSTKDVIARIDQVRFPDPPYVSQSGNLTRIDLTTPQLPNPKRPLMLMFLQVPLHISMVFEETITIEWFLVL